MCSSTERCNLLDISEYMNRVIIKSDKSLQDKLKKNGTNSYLFSVRLLLFNATNI